MIVLVLEYGKFERGRLVDLLGCVPGKPDVGQWQRPVVAAPVAPASPSAQSRTEP